MVNQQLLDYIKQQLRQNISREQIKSSLMANGWLPSDVEEGFSTITPRPSSIFPAPTQTPVSNIQPASNLINPTVRQQVLVNQKKSGSLTKIVFVFMLIVALGGAGWFVYNNYFNSSKIDTQIELPPTVYNTNQATVDPLDPIKKVFNDYISSKTDTQIELPPTVDNTNQATVDPLDPIKKVFNDYIAAKTQAELEATISKDSMSLVGSTTFTPNTSTNISFGVGNIELGGATAVLAVSFTKPTGERVTQNSYFILENGAWKVDFKRTFEELLATTNPITPPTTVIDLTVLDFQVNPATPNPPSYSNKNVTIEAVIKNNGTSTFVGVINYITKINGSNDFSGGIAGTLQPGATKTIDLMWGGYLFFAKNDPTKFQTGPGKYIFSIAIDPKKELNDTNRTNNTLTKTISFGP